MNLKVQQCCLAWKQKSRHFILCFAVCCMAGRAPVSEAETTPMPFENALELPSQAYDLIANAKVVWLGEMHGTNEAPKLFLGLIRLVGRRAEPPVVALEVPELSQPAFDEYIKTGDVAVLRERSFFKDEGKDGRSSVAMFKLLEALRLEKVAKVVCFDPAPVNGSQERDEKMAERLATAAKDFPKAKLLVLSGNVHSRVTEGTPWDSKYRPAGFELAKKLPAIVNFNLQYESGVIWACMGDKECGDNKVSGPSWSGTTKHYITLNDVPKDGHRGIIYTRTVSPSAPWLLTSANPYESADIIAARQFKRLPVPLLSGTKVTVRQGAFGKSSHNEPGNEYNWDFEVPFGTPIIAVGDGAVSYVSQPSVGGCDPKFAASANAFHIKLADGSVAQYLHVETDLKVGAVVRKGQIIARTALNGWLCYPHVHFGVYASDKQLYNSSDRKTLPIFFEGFPGGIAREGASYVIP